VSQAWVDDGNSTARPKVILLGGSHVMQTGWKRISKLPAIHDRAMHNQRIHARTQRRAGLQLCYLTPFGRVNGIRHARNLRSQFVISSLQPLVAQVPTTHFTFNSRWMPNFSMRLRSVARVMPSSFVFFRAFLLVDSLYWSDSYFLR
jgi:hypothetical protein